MKSVNETKDLMEKSNQQMLMNVEVAKEMGNKSQAMSDQSSKTLSLA